MFGSVYVIGKTEKYSFDDVLKILLEEHNPDTVSQAPYLMSERYNISHQYINTFLTMTMATIMEVAHTHGHIKH